jgi:hypothetical protein
VKTLQEMKKKMGELGRRAEGEKRKDECFFKF